MHKVEQCDDGRARYDAVAYQLGAVWCDNTTLYCIYGLITPDFPLVCVRALKNNAYTKP